MLKLARLDGGPEIFHTLQGEGTRAGRPSVFVRVSRCNLHCTWCDTDYTWNWEGTAFKHDRDDEPGYRKFKRDEQSVEMDPAAAAAHVLRFPCRHVVLTGGEPLLQQTGLTELAAALRAADPAFTFEVETNGTLVPTPAFDAYIEQYNVSPKLENSGNPRSPRENPAALAWFATSPKTWFKFVVSDSADVAEIEALAASAGISRSRILLMPEGRTPEALAANRDLVVRLCLDSGYSFTDRLHLRLFGARRGT